MQTIFEWFNSLTQNQFAEAKHMYGITAGTVSEASTILATCMAESGEEWDADHAATSLAAYDSYDYDRITGRIS